MRLSVQDVRTRVVITKLLVKIDRNPAASREIGLEDTSYFQVKAEAGKSRKEGKGNVEYTGTDYSDHWVV